MKLRLARKIFKRQYANRFSTLAAAERRVMLDYDRHQAECANCDGAPDGGHTGDRACRLRDGNEDNW